MKQLGHVVVAEGRRTVAHIPGVRDQVTAAAAPARPKQGGELRPTSCLPAGTGALPYSAMPLAGQNDHCPSGSPQHWVSGVNGAAAGPRAQRELNEGGPGKGSSLDGGGLKAQLITRDQPGTERAAAKVAE